MNIERLTPAERMAIKQARHAERMERIEGIREQVKRERSTAPRAEVVQALDERMLAEERLHAETFTPYAARESVYQDRETGEVKRYYKRVRPVSEMPASRLDASGDKRAAGMFRWLSDDRAQKGAGMVTRGRMMVMEAGKALASCGVSRAKQEAILSAMRSHADENGAYPSGDERAAIMYSMGLNEAQVGHMMALMEGMMTLGKGNRMVDTSTHKPR